MTHAVPQSTDSEQSYETPSYLVGQFAKFFGAFVLDCAATEDNKKAPHCYTIADNALLQDIAADLEALGGNGFINPPFEDIEPWVRHVAQCAARLPKDLGILMLLPASMATAWWAEAARFCETYVLYPRFTYEHPDPKRAAEIWANKKAGRKPEDWKPAAPAGSMALWFTRETAGNPCLIGTQGIYPMRVERPGIRERKIVPFDSYQNTLEERENNG